MLKRLDENHFRTAQKAANREPTSFKIGERIYFKNKQPGKWDLKWRPEYQIVCIKHDGLYLHIKTQATGKTRSCNMNIGFSFCLVILVNSIVSLKQNNISVITSFHQST